MVYNYIVCLCASQANLNSDNIRLMSAMLCAALYPNVVQVGIDPPSKALPAPLGFTLIFFFFFFGVPGPSSSGELQDDEQRSDEDAPQSQRAPLRDQKRRLRPRAPFLRQLHGERHHAGPRA